MQVDALALTLRPRPMSEATDLGVRLVQQHARSLLLTCGPVWAAVLLLALSTAELAPWLPTLLIFWLKPWLDRSLLFVLSRAVFGEATRFTDLWRAQRGVWWRQLPATLTLRRLSPWRAFTQPVYQLEGLRGRALRQRRNVLLGHHRTRAALVQAVFAHAEAALSLGLISLIAWFAPQGSDFGWGWMQSEAEPGSTLVTTLAYAAAVTLMEPFFVAAGFAMYLNRRVELEAWDIEQEFRLAFAH